MDGGADWAAAAGEARAATRTNGRKIFIGILAVVGIGEGLYIIAG
jgi:hypothetical protein